MTDSRADPGTAAGQRGARSGALEEGREPSGTLAIRVIAMPADTNPNGDIFGGWLLSQMDMAGGIVAVARAKGRVATVAVDAMTFHKAVHVGEIVSCYAEADAEKTLSDTGLPVRGRP
jgi:acyl-CoA thioesterase YciA